MLNHYTTPPRRADVTTLWVGCQKAARDRGELHFVPFLPVVLPSTKRHVSGLPAIAACGSCRLTASRRSDGQSWVIAVRSRQNATECVEIA